QRAFVHLLNEGAVALVGPLQGENARSLSALHGQRIHGPGPDGVNQVVGFLQLLAQLLIGPGQLGGGGRRLIHSVCSSADGLMPSAFNTLSRSDRSPTRRRTRPGLRLMSVGTPMRSSRWAKSGCWKMSTI